MWCSQPPRCVQGHDWALVGVVVAPPRATRFPSTSAFHHSALILSFFPVPLGLCKTAWAIQQPQPRGRQAATQRQQNRIAKGQPQFHQSFLPRRRAFHFIGAPPDPPGKWILHVSLWNCQMKFTAQRPPGHQPFAPSIPSDLCIARPFFVDGSASRRSIAHRFPLSNFNAMVSRSSLVDFRCSDCTQSLRNAPPSMFPHPSSTLRRRSALTSIIASSFDPSSTLLVWGAHPASDLHYLHYQHVHDIRLYYDSGI